MRTEDSLKERYQQVREIVVKPFSGLSRYHLFGGEYTGLGEPIGNSSVDNTENQAKELAFALSLSHHPMIEQLISDSNIKNLAREAWLNPNSERDVQSELDALANYLAQNAVLDGMKILDLGCGQRPAFAYCARNLGAKAYTVDIIPSDKLWVSDGQKEATEDHIQLDLRKPNAYDILRNKTGGNFDLVASSSIHEQAAFADIAGRAAPPRHLEDLALALAKDEGVYFNAEYLWDEEIRLKDPAVNYEERIRDFVSRA